MSDDVIEMLRAARVPHADGMSWTRGTGGLLAKAARPRQSPDEVARAVAVGWVPDLEDRATFLLACDEADRRGVLDVGLDVSGDRRLSIGACRAVMVWANDPLRPQVIAALARTLADSAPKETTP